MLLKIIVTAISNCFRRYY